MMRKKLLLVFSPRGFTLIETLISVLIISIVGATILAGINTFLRSISISQDTIRAQNLATEKMEEIKNMPYSQIATQYGAIYPPGTLADVEVVNSGDHTYTVRTYISFVDDPFDGNAQGTIAGKPQDFYPFDYKKVTIEVKDKNDSKVFAKISTNVAANAAETSDNSGILFVKVIDSFGNPVPNARIHLTNTNPNPDVDINTITDTAGLLQIPLLPVDTTNGYNIVASLTGYSTDSTNPDSVASYDPVQPNFNILAQQVTNITLAIDRVSSINITVTNESGALVSGLPVTVRGDKATYIDSTGTNPDILKYSQSHTSNGTGQINLTGREWDNYSFSVPTGYFVISTSPYQKVNVPANQSLAVSLVVSTNSSWPRINEVVPILGVNNSSLTVEIVGENLTAGSTVRLERSGQGNIVSPDVVSSDGNTKLTGTLDLNGASVGVWDLVVISGGKTTRQVGGFTINTP